MKGAPRSDADWNAANWNTYPLHRTPRRGRSLPCKGTSAREA